MVAPLTALLQGHQAMFSWNPEAEKTLQCLKDDLCSALVWQQLNHTLLFVVEVDASEIKVGAVLYQHQG